MRNYVLFFLIAVGASIAVAWKPTDVKPPEPVRIEGTVTETIYSCDDSTADFARPCRETRIYIRKQIGNGPIKAFTSAGTDSLGRFNFYVPANSGPATYYFYESWKDAPFHAHENTFCYTWDNDCLREIHEMPDYVLLYDPKVKNTVPISVYKNCEGLSVCCTVVVRTKTLTK